MTKEEKIASLSSAMTTSVRKDNPKDTFYHFTDTAPEELRNLYIEHYAVKDIDYETFSRACGIVSEIYADKPDITQDAATDEICERASDSGSVYTYQRLQYLDASNESDISDLIREYGLTSIAEACLREWPYAQWPRVAITQRRKDNKPLPQGARNIWTRD